MIKAEENICLRYHRHQRETSVQRGNELKVSRNNNFALGGFIVKKVQASDWTVQSKLDFSKELNKIERSENVEHRMLLISFSANCFAKN